MITTKTWTAVECRAVIASAEGERLHVYFCLSLDTGARQGELLALTWPDIDLDSGTMRVARSLGERASKPLIKEPKSVSGRRAVRLAPVVHDRPGRAP